ATHQLGAAAAMNITINGNRTLDATLPPAFTAFCPGDGSLSTACPCQNTGASGHGCANSQVAAGALLGASGTTHPDAAVLSVSGMLPTAFCIFLQGNASNASGLVFGDGVRCTAGSLKRLATKSAVGGAASFPQAGDPSISSRSATLGDVIPIAG